MLLELFDEYRDTKGNLRPVFGNFDPNIGFVSAMPELSQIQEAIAHYTLDDLVPPEVQPLVKSTEGAIAAWLSAAQLENLAGAAQHSLFGVVNVTGLVSDRALNQLPEVYNTVIDVAGPLLEVVRTMKNPHKSAAFGRELMEQMGLQVLSTLSAIPVYGQIIAGVVQGALGIYHAVQSSKTGLGDERRTELTTYVSPATDAAVVQNVVASLRSLDRNITHLFMPKRQGDWLFEERGEVVFGQGRFSQQGFKLPDWGFGFVQEEGAGGYGFMPGTHKVMGLLEWKAPNRLLDGVGSQANWKKIRGNYRDRSCLKTEEYWDGYRNGEIYNCRQNVPRGQISRDARGTKDKDKYYQNKGDADYIKGSLDTMVNVGDMYTATRQTLGGIWGDVLQPSPLMYSVDAEGCYNAWKQMFEQLFDQDAPRLWERYHGHGWRYALSHFLSYFLVSRIDGRFGGRGTIMDWRENWPEALTTVRGNWPQITSFHLTNSIFERGISPTLMDLRRRQLKYYRSTMVAYLWENQGAHWDTGAGHIRYDDMGSEFVAARKWLIQSSRRFQIRMADVVDPEYFQALVDSGVDADNDPGPGSRLAAVTPDGGPPLLTLTGEPVDHEPLPDPIGGLPGLPIASMKPKKKSSGGSGLGLVAVAAIAALALKK